MSYGIYFSTGLVTNIDYWKPLIMEYIEESDYIRIDCWNNEKRLISILEPLCYEMDLQSNNNMHIFKFKITGQNIDELVYNAVGDKGNIKWFSFFLMKDDDMLLSFEHYGKEFSIDGISMKEIKFIKYFIPKGSNVNTYRTQPDYC